MNFKRKEKEITNYVYIFVLLMPLWWILGFNLFIYHLFSFFVFLKIIFTLKKTKQGFSNSPIINILFVYLLIYFISLCINIFYEDTSRILGSVYNFSLWVMGYFFLVAISNVNYCHAQWMKIFNAFRINGLIISGVGIISLIIWKFTGVRLEVKTLMSLLLPQTNSDIISDTINPLLLRIDWILNEPQPRLSAFYLYPTALAIGMAICIFMTVIYHNLKQSKESKKWIEILIMFIPLFFSFSRIVFIGMAFSLVIVKGLTSLSNKKNFYGFYWKVLLSCGIMLPFLISKFYSFVNLLLESREGSTNLRLTVYKLAFDYVIDKNILLGVGVKPILEDIRIPIGSHSTIVGGFLKTGILGLSLILIINMIVVICWLNIKKNISTKEDLMVWKYSGASILSLIIWMATEDIDAPQNITFFYFLIIGLIIILNKKVTKGVTNGGT